jgi:large subunit ribosomal protein L14e
MPLLEEGRVCIKKSGRDAGSKAVVTKVIDDRFVSIITAERPRERKCNVSHLEFLNEKVDPKDTAQMNKLLGIKEKPQAPAQKRGKA